MKQLLLITLLALADHIALPQSPHWPVPPNRLQFSATGVTVDPLPGALAVTTPYYAANCGYDAAGNILFYVVDDKIYDHLGTPAGNLTPGTHNEYNGKNIIIIPDPADCNTSLVIHTTFTNPVSYPCRLNTELLYTRVTNSSTGLAIQHSNGPIPNSYGINYCNSFSAMCVSPPKTNGIRFLYIAGDKRLFKYQVDGTGITLVNNITTGIENGPADLELSPSGDKLAFANVSGGSNKSIKWVYLDANGDFVWPVYQMDAWPTAYGLEFIDNNRALVAAGNDTRGGIYLANLSTPASCSLLIGNTDYTESQLEKGLDGKVYAASANGLLGIHASTFATNIIALPMGSNVEFGHPANFYSLPRQLDNENYATVFSCASFCPATLTITGNYTTPLTEASASISSSGATSVPTGYTVKLDANNINNSGFIQLQPGFQTQPGAVFIAKALDGCGGNMPMRTTGPGSVAAGTDHTIPAVTGTLTVYPNPATGRVTVRHPATLPQLQVYDVTGILKQTVKTGAGGQTVISISHLPAGIYYIQARGQEPKKLVKQ